MDSAAQCHRPTKLERPAHQRGRFTYFVLLQVPMRFWRTTGIREDIAAWRTYTLDNGPEAWVFPSERNTPLSRDNVWRRFMQPKFAEAGLGWATFQVMRRTHSTLMNELKVDP